MCGFPCIVGCIDGTHMRIAAPAGDYTHEYVKQKYHHSIHVQVRSTTVIVYRERGGLGNFVR